jgi:hypothetical protein
MAEPTYKTFQIWIKPGHRLFPYLEQMCLDAKHLYNTTNFYIRQVFTSFRQDKPLHPLQLEVLNTLQQYIGAMNECQFEAYRSRLVREQRKPVEERRNIRCNRFDLPSAERPMIGYHFLDCLFKVMGQSDQSVLQQVEGTLFRHLSSRENPEGRTVHFQTTGAIASQSSSSNQRPVSQSELPDRSTGCQAEHRRHYHRT